MTEHKGLRFTSDSRGDRVEEVTYTDEQVADLERREMEHRLSLVELDETLNAMPSTAVGVCTLVAHPHEIVDALDDEFA